MKDKGFTLVELLGVIVLLGILGIVIIPKVGDSITNSKEQAYKVQEESIKKAVNDFLVDNTDYLEENDTITIKLGVLKQKGYLPVNIKNPKTRKNISNESLITITRVGDSYTIKLALIDLQDVTEEINNNSPILVLNGDYIEYVEVNDLYQEKGAIAKSANGETISTISKQIKLNNVEKSTVDTSQLLTYNVIYSATDSNGLTTSATRTVIVRDTKAPTITFPAETTLHVSEVADFNIMQGVSVTDNYTQTPTVTSNSSLAALPGKYVITYTVTDSSENQTIEKRVINVNNDWSKYYTNVEYIQSTGTQYILTDIVPDDTTGVYAKLSSQNTALDSIYFGSKGEGDTRFTSGNVENSGNRLYYGWNTIAEVSKRQIIMVNSIYTFKMNYLNDRKIYFNENIIENNLPALGQNNYPISIFTNNNSGTVSTAKSKIKLYELKISEGNKIKYNLIPCYRNKDKEIGLYDLINNKFYTNSGTGRFKVKELKDSFDNYQRLSYIQSTGEQYIITDIIPNNTMGVYAKLSSQNTANDVIFLGSRGTENSRFYIGNYETNKLYYGWNTYTSSANMPAFELNTVYEVKMNYLNTRNNYLNDQLKESNNPTLAENNYPLAIFSSNGAGNISINSNKSKMKLYELKISEQDKITYDFVPCYRKTDNVAGLYDLVNDKFYENSGTGEFTPGNPIN